MLDRATRRLRTESDVPLVGEAVRRLERERYAPLAHSVLLGVSYGGFGAGLGRDVEAHAQVQLRRQQIETARDAVRTARRSYDKNLDRIENGQGLPIEALQAMQALAQAQRDYLRAVTDFNIAQFTLERALGRSTTTLEQ